MQHLYSAYLILSLNTLHIINLADLYCSIFTFTYSTAATKMNMHIMLLFRYNSQLVLSRLPILLLGREKQFSVNTLTKDAVSQ